MTVAHLRELIDARSAHLGVVGLGYVGLPVACILAETGFKVTGVDVKADRVASIRAGRSPIEGNEPGLADLMAKVAGRGGLRATTDIRELASADIVLVCVDTPVDPSDHRPRYEGLRAACRSLSEVLESGALVIVESTIGPGTIERVVRPIFEGRGVLLGHCPERVMPGRLLHNLRAMSRAVGGESPEVAGAMAALYSTYVKGELDLTDPITAELVKTTENAFRDVNIAFANQVALICQEVGGDVWKVRELVNKSPGRNMLLPGAGVGGHCIPKDPWLLAAGGDRPAPLIEAARALNEAMPIEVARLAAGLLGQAGLQLGSAEVVVLGYAYLEDSDDKRHSPSASLVAELAAAGCRARVHDPYVPEYRRPLEPLLSGADLAVVMVSHTRYRELDLDTVGTLMRRRLLVDARHVFEPSAMEAAGFRFRSLGIGDRIGSPSPSGGARP